MPGLKNPDFICIGPEKTGTSWLHCILRDHPDIFLPYQKELRYWNEGDLFPGHSLKNLFLSQHWHYIGLRRQLTGCISQLFSKNFYRNNQDLELWWQLKYILGKRTPEWYSKLFSESADRRSGDITPTYYQLSEERVLEISQHYPSMKIIILVRDPVERAWSKAKMILLKNPMREFSTVNQKEFYDVFDHIYSSWLSYEETIKIWNKYFNHVHISFYDELQTKPESIYGDICRFLDVVPNAQSELLEKVVNQGARIEMPDEFQRFLVDQYGNEINEMDRNHPRGYPASWKEKYGL